MKVIPALIVAIVALAAGAWFANQSTSDEVSIDSIQRQLASSLVLPEDFKTVPQFSLLNQEGQTVSNEFLKDRWSMLFFGFIHCPDVCPMALTVVSEAKALIKADQGNNGNLPVPQVVFVSVDPKRDTPELMKNYVSFFDPEFKALTGDLNGVYELTRPLNIVRSVYGRRGES